MACTQGEFIATFDRADLSLNINPPNNALAP